MEEKEKLVFTPEHISLVWRSSQPVVKEDEKGEKVKIYPQVVNKEYIKSPCWVLIAIRYGNLDFKISTEKNYVWVEKANTPSADELKSALSSEEVRKEIDTVLAYEGYPTLDSCIMPVKNEHQLEPEWMDKAYFASITVWPQYRFNLGCGSGYIRENCRIVNRC